MAERPVGRPSNFTPETITLLEQAFMMGCTDPEACLYANIGTTSLYSYQEKHPKFTERKKLLKNKPFLIARSELLKGLRGNPELSLKYLERKKKDEFSLRQEMTGADGGKLENHLTVYLPKEDEE